MDRRDYLIIAGLLLPFFIALPWGLWKKSQLTDAREENVVLQDSITDLSTNQVNLEDEKETLREAYKAIVSDNEALKDSLEKKGSTVVTRYLPSPNVGAPAEELEAQVVELETENEAIRDTVRDLREQNIMAIEDVKDLRKEVAEVKKENRRLTQQVLQLTRNNARMQERMDRLLVQGFRATDFKVSLFRDEAGDKLTTKAGKVRSLAVAFSLNNVSEAFHGDKAFYLVLTDPTGAPIIGQSPIKVTTSVRGQEMQLPALARIDRTVSDTQRFLIDVPLEDRLVAGSYKARIITDVGMVGAAGFTVE